MHEGGAGGMLSEGVILLGFALAFVLLFRRLGLGATLGYLVAGAVVGPQVLGLVGGAEAKINIAELGITLLLFIVGLELAPSRLWRMRREIFGLGLAQVALCGLAVSAVIYTFTGFSLAASLAIGLPLGLSSTAQVLPMLQSAGRLRTPFGERAFAILLFQDLSLIPLITIIAALSRNPEVQEGPPGWQLAVISVVAIAGLILAGRFLIRPLFRLIGVLGEREMFVVAALFTIVAAAALMQMLGLSTALGAFIAGVMLASSPYRHELEADVEPFRSILLGLFFLSIGMLLDLSAIAERPAFVALMALALIATKTAVIFAIGLLIRMEWRNALALGLLLSQGGEFGFVLFAQAQDGLLIAPEAASLFGAVVTISMAATPFLMMIMKRFRAAPDAGAEREGPSADGASAVVVGYGRFGQTVAQMLVAAGIRVTIIDSDVEMIDVANNFGARVYFGDGTRIDLLRQAGAHDARAVLFCMDGEGAGPDLISAVREHFPDTAIFVRAFDRRGVIRLAGTPADFVVREMFESAIAMARKALEKLGESLEAIDEAESAYRERDCDRMEQQISSGDLRSARDRIFVQED
ncbi:cation:proton antiporter domain-containing protein [Croceicoccus naphthovorans]|uniref:Sodium:proton exchanger n=1 Tax=Croceicoccus naphthovorans TaxID=1348774 RepID=A0A0G3XGS1_9SPHN|nr:cation:proton antiporter [Croceicoccus naphthovorans]AKM09836.1 sodium:proton exchanger [Croceicoccus naphthovorans]MBB3991275.1 CPA2 family monovalent cation:H+ antiporter-2/glutathione-regulated potassium-efflux system protein KefB [Croceicoccus naphthovorans]